LLAITTDGRSHVLGRKMHPVDADGCRNALVSYLFSGVSKPMVYLSEKVKVLKFSNKEASLEVNQFRYQKRNFYIWLGFFVAMIGFGLALGIVFSGVDGSYNFAIVVSILAIPALLCAGNLYYKGLYFRRRILVSLESKSFTIERYSVRDERTIASKTFLASAIKVLSLRTITSSGITVFVIQVELDNRKKERFIVMDNFLSAQRFMNIINVFLYLIRNGKSFRNPDGVDNLLTYGRTNFHDLEGYNFYIENRRLSLQFDLE
jgi:hypothetical protein